MNWNCIQVNLYGKKVFIKKIFLIQEDDFKLFAIVVATIFNGFASSIYTKNASRIFQKTKTKLFVLVVIYLILIETV